MLIDEVDVFFSEHFYGKTFNPIIKFRCDEIREIIQFIWEKGKPRGGVCNENWKSLHN